MSETAVEERGCGEIEGGHGMECSVRTGRKQQQQQQNTLRVAWGRVFAVDACGPPLQGSGQMLVPSWVSAGPKERVSRIVIVPQTASRADGLASKSLVWYKGCFDPKPAACGCGGLATRRSELVHRAEGV